MTEIEKKQENFLLDKEIRRRWADKAQKKQRNILHLMTNNCDSDSGIVSCRDIYIYFVIAEPLQFCFFCNYKQIFITLTVQWFLLLKTTRSGSTTCFRHNWLLFLSVSLFIQFAELVLGGILKHIPCFAVFALLMLIFVRFHFSFVVVMLAVAKFLRFPLDFV